MPRNNYIVLVMLSYVLLLCICSVFAQDCLQTNAGDVACNSWIINNNDISNNFGTLHDVQNVEFVTIESKDYVQITATGIPSYPQTIDQATIDWLNSRPKASEDFVNGATSAQVGDIIEFGDDIGYGGPCALGYWPPGPVCPEDVSHVELFPLEPQENTGAECYTTRGIIGLWVNGVSVYNWWDTSSYNSENEWHTMAAYAEYYDVDICAGHAASGDYHHHAYPNCLADRLGDDGSQKSPVYGYAADGYPILGPWVSSGVRAQSCWKVRDYEDPNSATGCGASGKRTCLLVDQFDITQGTIATSLVGPDTDEIYTTMSRNEIVAESGFFFEDHYYDPDCSSLGDEYLDEHNGRIDSEYGYVYHATVSGDINDAVPVSVFPHFLGPTFYGQLDGNTVVQCTESLFDSNGPGTGGPGTGGPGTDDPTVTPSPSSAAQTSSTPTNSPVNSVVPSSSPTPTPAEEVISSNSESFSTFTSTLTFFSSTSSNSFTFETLSTESSSSQSSTLLVLGSLLVSFAAIFFSC